MPSALSQSSYQVRFEWGVAGLQRLEPSDVVVVVDIIHFTSDVAVAAAEGANVALATAGPADGADVARAAAASAHGSLVLAGALRNAAAVARAIMAEQHRHGDRVSIAVVAAGAAGPRAADEPLRFAVEDQLGAGAVIAALTDLGIDHCSPEAVAAAESFRALRGAVRHLLTASGSGRGADRDQVVAAARIDDLESVPVLRDGVFVAL